MIRSSFLASIASALFLAIAAPATAAPIPFVSALDGSQEVPANGSAAVGAASMLWDPATNKIQVLSVSVSGIALADVTAFHIHLGAPGVNGPVIVDFLGAEGLSFTDMGGFLALSGTNISFPSANASDLLAGDTYFNLHTTAFPGGEIRGQIKPIPEPASAALFTLGALVVGAATRRNPLAA